MRLLMLGLVAALLMGAAGCEQKEQWIEVTCESEGVIVLQIQIEKRAWAAFSGMPSLPDMWCIETRLER